MKKALIFGAVVIIVHTEALAQWASTVDAPTQMSSGQRSARAQQLFDEYRVKRGTDRVENRKSLDEIHALGVQKTSANVSSLRTLLASRISAEEKVALARILGSLYSSADPTGMNTVIAQDLRGLARAGQRDVARAAVLAYSRLASFPDTREVLASARSNGAINDDEYFGELAHVAPFAPVDEQVAYVSEIRRSKNMYGAEVLTYALQEKEIIKKLAPHAKEQLLLLVSEAEPSFPLALGEFGFTDAIRFATWLHARAVLEGEVKGTTYRDVVFANLNDERTDPRKIMAFLSSNEGKQMLREVGQRAPFEKMQKRITLYSRQLPQNQAMKDIVDSVNATLATLKS